MDPVEINAIVAKAREEGRLEGYRAADVATRSLVSGICSDMRGRLNRLHLMVGHLETEDSTSDALGVINLAQEQLAAWELDFGNYSKETS